MVKIMLKDKEIKAHSREQIISGMLFALEVMLLFFMSSFFFPGSDELDFQNYLSFSSLNEFLHNVYYFGNGRFIGNAIGVFFSFYPQWFYVVQSVLTALFCVLIEKLTDVRHARHFVMAFFILKPVWCFAETFVRIAMYANYFIPLLLFALTLLIIKKAYRDNKILSFPLLAALFVAGFAEQLFVESNTVVNTAFSLLLVLFFINKRKKKSAPVVLLASNIIGAVPILFYSFYVDVESTFNYQIAPAYRNTLFSGGLSNAFTIAIENAKYPLYYLSMFFVFFAATAAVICICAKKFGASKKQMLVLGFSCVVYTILCIYTHYLQIKYQAGLPDEHSMMMVGALCVLFLLSYIPLLALLYTVAVKNCRHKTIITGAFLMGFMSYAPFLVVAPCRFRCCEQMLFFFVLALLMIVHDLVQQTGIHIFKPAMVFGVCCCAAMILYSVLYSKQKAIYNYKVEYCKTSYYLPLSDTNLVANGNQDLQWKTRAGFEHEFIPLEEFEKLISEK